MSNSDWYLVYDGPKNLELKDGVFVCMIGFNVHGECGGVIGKEAIGRHLIADVAIGQARAEYEAFKEK